MDCTSAQRVSYGTHMLAKEANDWWLETRRRLEAHGEEITWIVFRMEFLRKYFPKDVRGKKEIEFLELKQWNKSVVEYAANCGAEGHIDSQCQKPKKTAVGGKVFALSGTQTSSEDGLVRGTCFINSIPLITNIDTGATHCFIADDCVERLGLTLSAMNGEMVVELPAKGTMTTSLVCLNRPLSIFDRDFVVDFACLPLVGLDVVLGMNWLKRNYVHINCFNNTVRFSSLEEEEVGLLTGKQLKQLMQDEAQMFSLMASLSFENQARIDELKVVQEFPEVFLDDIPDVPPEREVEFTIDLVPDPSHVIQMDDVQVRDNLTVEMMPVRIKDREVKVLRGKEIPLVKVV
ncbi:uncharacterized protein LOC131659977 [Vicia villosa]|uniref:uncharacterized protein LOC131659977 n=1 Tax=Vicia villosa TaxID=3911 RepID=UPI00273C5C54|nr:uncharacterized protein LOC131659977 [Vicia villosa]